MDTPDTLNYMIMGYSVIFGVMIIYLISLAVRWRNLKQDEAMLSDLDKEQDS
jgi:hypothetical protein